MSSAITACAFIHKDGKLFIAKRAESKKFLPGKFELPGGHVEQGENVGDALKREIREELGMEIEVHDPFYVFSYTNNQRQTHSIEILYFATLTDPHAIVQLHPEDHSEYRWVDAAEAAQFYAEDDEEYKGVIKGFEILKKDGKIIIG